MPPPIKTSASPPPHSDSESDSDEDAEKSEEEERRLEEQEALERKLRHLQSVMTADTLGLVRDGRPKTKGKEPRRGRDMMSPTSPSPLRQAYTRNFRRDPSSSDFNSNMSSPQGSVQGSIPSIPSPSESQVQSPVARHFTHTKSPSPPAVSVSQARGVPHMQYRPMAIATPHASDRSSTQGSAASSYSDIGGRWFQYAPYYLSLNYYNRVHESVSFGLGERYIVEHS